MYKVFFKPFFDFVLSIILLLALSPFIVLTIILLTILNRGQIFFFQERPGKDGVVFKIIKFKTMNDKTDVHGNFLPDSQRLTKVGKIIRKLSIDEILQLINVIKGDMSIVGPRPLLTEYLPLYNSTQKTRHNVRPGITGWAQVNGRNAISWEHKFKLDVWYVNNISLFLDLKIILLTIKKVIVKEGVNSSTSATMEKFNGSN